MLLLNSIPLIEGRVVQRYLEHWKNLVRIWVYLCMKTIIKERINDLEKTCIRFVKYFEKLYYRGRRSRLKLMKSNSHSLLHLADAIRDAGPGWVWWCFGAESFNGMIDGMAKSKVHLDVRLGNALCYHQNEHAENQGGENIAAGGDLEELRVGLHNMVLDVAQEEGDNEQPAVSRYGTSKSGPKSVSISQQERQEIRNYVQRVHNLNAGVVQRQTLVNRDSSWVRFTELGGEEGDEMFYGQVDYYIRVVVQEVAYELARVHVHPEEDLDPDLPNRLVRMKSEQRLREDAADVRALGLVGRLTTQNETFFVSWYLDQYNMVNPAVVFMEDKPIMVQNRQ
ncbi:hypothetical protein DFH27DRAFT_648291 [Peziza echinospora]|nr:hypothetical protein DFH27DRAFT_648291 [Peziza echinospora]